MTQYVREEMNRADRLKAEGEGRRGNTVGFALTILQRRLASSPEAILRSLERRKARLEKRRREMATGGRDDFSFRSRVDVILGREDDDGLDDRQQRRTPRAQACFGGAHGEGRQTARTGSRP